MQIQSNAFRAITVFQGCSHSCDWELWCAQYDHISRSPKNIVDLEDTFEFLPTVERLLSFTLPIAAEESVLKRVKHYLSRSTPGRNSSEIIYFCHNIVQSGDSAFQNRCVDLVDIACRRRLMPPGRTQELTVWVEQQRAETLHTTISQALTDAPQKTPPLRTPRKI